MRGERLGSLITHISIVAPMGGMGRSSKVRGVRLIDQNKKGKLICLSFNAFYGDGCF